MGFITGNLSRTNGILLLLTVPYSGRIWLEAVIWRLEHGPQMLGFSLLHAGAGALTVPILLSMLVGFLYSIWAIVVIFLQAFPKLRAKTKGISLVVAGLLVSLSFDKAAGLLQREMSSQALSLGIAVFCGLGIALLSVAILSIYKSRVSHVIA